MSVCSEQISVGRAIVNGQVYTRDNAYYTSMMGLVESRAAQLAAEKAAARSKAAPCVMSVVLQQEELRSMTDLYPEFRLIPCGFYRPAHAFWTAARKCANDWLTMQAKKMATDVVHLGGSLVTYLESDFESAVLLVDPSLPTAVHERHASGLDCSRLYASYDYFSGELGRPASVASWREFLAGSNIRYADDIHSVREVDVMCVDGSLYSYGPAQVAAMMLEVKASVTYGFFPYHPSMLLNAEGEFPDCGVHYTRDGKLLRFRYPEGTAGAQAYNLTAWQSWLSSHVFHLGDSSFQVELLKNRGSFMFYRMTKYDRVDGYSNITHALELPIDQPSYVVKSWRLARLGADPTVARNWAQDLYIVSARLVDRLLQFALQLPKEQFTRYAIRKQVHVINDRVTIEGTSVKVNTPLGVKLVEALSVDVYARAFAERYESGNLVSEAISAVQSMADYASASAFTKVWLVVCFCAAGMWDYTLGPVNKFTRKVSDVVRGFFTRTVELGIPTFEKCPSYLRWEQLASGVAVVGKPSLAAALTIAGCPSAVGFSSEWTKLLGRHEAEIAGAEFRGLRVEEAALFSEPSAPVEDVDTLVKTVRGLNEMDEPGETRRDLVALQAVRLVNDERVQDFDPVADPVRVLNEFYDKAVPGVAHQALEFDTASLSLDPQDRVLAAPYLKMPKYFGDAPGSKLYYRSKLMALNVPKRQNTHQELLSAIAARNLNAPQVALPQNDAATAKEVWEVFLDAACVPEARGMIRAFQEERVGLEEEALRDWCKQSTPDKVAAVKKDLEDSSRALGEMPVEEYLVMLKADVKPTLSQKPIYSRTEPQVIVYHEKPLSALYSSMFRVLVRRFLSLLKPNYHVNLLKDVRDISAFISQAHPFGASSLLYLENDFSKFDKSQGKFVWVLEEYVYGQLGLNEEWLNKWLGGHIDCKMRALSLGLSLHVMYQRKSGDATTAFGNVILNLLSVTYAYRGTEVCWALFMGDDSLVCAKRVCRVDTAVQVLAEVFNLGAKTYVTSAPYFASNFVLLSSVNDSACLVADPIKRIERLSMHVSGDDPQWDERFVSARDSMSSYMSCMKTVGLEAAVSERYAVEISDVAGVTDALATVLTDKKKFREIWEEYPETSNY